MVPGSSAETVSRPEALPVPLSQGRSKVIFIFVVFYSCALLVCWLINNGNRITSWDSSRPEAVPIPPPRGRSKVIFIVVFLYSCIEGQKQKF
jgi:hypothetical protein